MARTTTKKDQSGWKVPADFENASKCQGIVALTDLEGTKREGICGEPHAHAVAVWTSRENIQSEKDIRTYLRMVRPDLRQVKDVREAIEAEVRKATALVQGRLEGTIPADVLKVRNQTRRYLEEILPESRKPEAPRPEAPAAVAQAMRIRRADYHRARVRLLLGLWTAQEFLEGLPTDSSPVGLGDSEVVLRESGEDEEVQTDVPF